MEIKQYKLHEVIGKMEFGQVAFKISGAPSDAYCGVGTVIYYDESDDGILKFLHNGHEVIVCRREDTEIEDMWIIVDKDGVV